jgi:hypothetical protein
MKFLNSMKHSELIKSRQNLRMGHKYALILLHSLNYKNVLLRLKRTNYFFFYFIATLTQCIEPSSSGARNSSLLDNDIRCILIRKSPFSILNNLTTCFHTVVDSLLKIAEYFAYQLSFIAFAEVIYTSFPQKISFLSGRLGPAFLLCKQYIKSLFANRNVELSSWMFLWC